VQRVVEQKDWKTRAASAKKTGLSRTITTASLSGFRFTKVTAVEGDVRACTAEPRQTAESERVMCRPSRRRSSAASLRR